MVAPTGVLARTDSIKPTVAQKTDITAAQTVTLRKLRKSRIAEIAGKITRDEFEIALSPTIRSVEKYYTQLEHEKEEIEELIINKLKTHVKSIDNVLLRNLLLFLLPSIKNLIIRFLIFDKSC